MKNDMVKNYIKIRGAKENNLKNLSVDIPRDSFVVLTAEEIYGVALFICPSVPGNDGKT